MPLYQATPSVPAFTNKASAYLTGMVNLSTSVTLGNGSLRLCPLFFNAPFTLTAVGCEFTVAGDNVSVYRMAMYADDGNCWPGALALDAGSVSTGTSDSGTVATGGTPGVYMRTLGAATPFAAGLYWVGGAVQGVTVTQPTMRVSTFGHPLAFGSSSVPAANANFQGYVQTSVTGTPPSNFQAFTGTGGSTPGRIILRLQ